MYKLLRVALTDEHDVVGMRQAVRELEAAATETLPVLVVSSKTPSDDERLELRRMHAAFLPKSRLEADRLTHGLLEARCAARDAPARRAPSFDAASLP